MGTFQDSDGSGYLLIHGGIIYHLNKDYHSAEEKVLAGLSVHMVNLRLCLEKMAFTFFILI